MYLKNSKLAVFLILNMIFQSTLGSAREIDLIQQELPQISSETLLLCSGEECRRVESEYIEIQALPADPQETEKLLNAFSEDFERKSKENSLPKGVLGYDKERGILRGISAQGTFEIDIRKSIELNLSGGHSGDQVQWVSCLWCAIALASSGGTFAFGCPSCAIWVVKKIIDLVS